MGPSIYYVTTFSTFLNPPPLPLLPKYQPAHKVLKVRENCHFLKPPPYVSLNVVVCAKSKEGYFLTPPPTLH